MQGVTALCSKWLGELWLSVVNNTQELIFEYNYLREYVAKIENIRYN